MTVAEPMIMPKSHIPIFSAPIQMQQAGKVPHCIGRVCGLAYRLSDNRLMVPIYVLPF